MNQAQESIESLRQRVALSTSFGWLEMGTRVTSGRFTAKRSCDAQTGVETWGFEDHKKWMQ